MQQNIAYKEEVLKYYKECWLERFRTGHNPKSLAMHLGYFEHGELDNDIAKNKMNQFVADELGISNLTGTIVDAGCGIGGTCLYLAENYAGLKITGINISAEQIDLAKRFIAKKPYLKSNISFLCEDYSSTSILSGSVEALYSIESLCHAEKKNDFYNEAFRVLKPGGILLIIDYVDTLKNNDYNNISALKKVFEKGWAVNEYLISPTEKLEKAGFTDISFKSIKPRVMPGILKSYHKAHSKISIQNGNIPETMRMHLDACVALKHLADHDAIDYCLIKCRKPSG